MRHILKWGIITLVSFCLPAGTAQGQSRVSIEDEITTTFLSQESEVWQLEGTLLREAMASIAKAPNRKLSELEMRRVIRNGRSSSTLRSVRNFINEYLQQDSIEMLKEIADVNHVEPEDVFADYLTVEATVDYSLMASAYATVHGDNLDKFPRDARDLLEQLVEGVRRPPVPANDIEVGRVRGSRLTITVFGCDIEEEITKVEPSRRSANLTWNSNYFFLRDLKDRVPPKEIREETLTDDNGKWRIGYEKELDEFVKSTGRTEWAKKVRELADVDTYLDRKDPLHETKSKREDYVYDPEADADPTVVSFTGRKVADQLDSKYDDEEELPVRRR